MKEKKEKQEHSGNDQRNFSRIFSQGDRASGKDQRGAKYVCQDWIV